MKFLQRHSSLSLERPMQVPRVLLDLLVLRAVQVRLVAQVLLEQLGLKVRQARRVLLARQVQLGQQDQLEQLETRVLLVLRDRRV